MCIYYHDYDYYDYYSLFLAQTDCGHCFKIFLQIAYQFCSFVFPFYFKRIILQIFYFVGVFTRVEN